MDLWKELLCHVLEGEPIEIRFPKAPRIEKLLKDECYQALKEIKSVLEDPMLDDENCFLKVERIIRVLERRGIFCGGRHDF